MSTFEFELPLKGSAELPPCDDETARAEASRAHTRLDNLAPTDPYDDTAIKADVAALTTRVGALEGKPDDDTDEEAQASIATLTNRVAVLEARPVGSGQGTRDGFHLDDYTGTDDERWDKAEAAQKAATDRNMPPIILPHRPISLTRPRTFYSGQKVVGLGAGGQKNPELAAGNYVGPEITLGGTIAADGASLFNGNGGSIYDVYMAGFSVQGSQGSAKHQFADVPTGTLYACQFDSLSFNMMAGVFGRGASRKCLMTQVALTGSWTMNNAWDTQLNVGGSDCVFFMDSFANVGTSGSSAQTGDVNRYYFRFDSLEATVGKAYLSTLNGWRGLLISGSGSSVDLHGGVYEGYKSTRQNGLLSGPGPGTQIRVTGGAVSLHGTKIGQGMDNPDASEGGLLQVDGGEVSVFGATFYGRNLGTVPAVKVNGGRVSVSGLMRRQNEAAYWTGRPIVSGTVV